MASRAYFVINAFAQVWQKYYGQEYYPSPKDFRHAKLFLECHNNEFQPDEIVSRADVYMNEPFYSGVRHGFTAFINNIGSFIALPEAIERRNSPIEDGLQKFMRMGK